MTRSLDQFIHEDALVLGEYTTVLEAARAMFQRKAGSAVVCDKGGRLVGIVTDRDLSTQALAFGHSPNAPLREFMTTKVCKVNETQHLSEVLHLMERYGVRRIPVMRKLDSGREKCVGIITLDDLIVEKMVDINVLSRIVSQQVTKAPKKGAASAA